jgi:hypothetical protein
MKVIKINFLLKNFLIFLFFLLFFFNFVSLTLAGLRPCRDCNDCNCAMPSCNQIGSWIYGSCNCGGDPEKIYRKRYISSCYCGRYSPCYTEEECVYSSACKPACSDTRDCGTKCASAGCDKCACDSDYQSPTYSWSSLGCSSDCSTCYCGELKCSCSGWTARGCGEGSCGSLQRRYTQTCTPSGCSSESKCENDSSCCICGSWQNGACNAAGDCPLGKRRQTRTCSPSGCDTTSRCVTDSACNCVCDWTDAGCGQGGCALNRMYQTGVCNYPDCATTRCVVHPECVSSCTISLSPSPLNVGLQKGRNLTADVDFRNSIVSRVNFSSSNTSIATVNPAQDNDVPYVTTVYGVALGNTSVTATATLNPEGSCTTDVDVTVRPTAWFQTQGGDIYTGASLSSDIPSTADDLNFSTKLDNWPGIIAHQDPDGVVNFGDGYPSNDTAYHWLAESKYEGKPYGSFQFFKKKFAEEMVSETYGSGRGDLPAEDGVYYAQSSRTLSGSSWNVDDNRWVVLLVEGDVNINSNIRLPKGSFLAIAATGDINFGDGVGQAHGVFVADGTISTGVGDEEFKGEGVFAAGSFDLGRDFEDERNGIIPIEFFKARSDFIMSSYKDVDNNLWWFFHKWQEIAP